MRGSDLDAIPSNVSVIIVIGNNRRRAMRAIGSVLRQSFDGSIEILVVDLADRDHQQPLEADDARIRWIDVPPSSTFGQARADAVEAARGSVVAFLEEHCEAMPGWIRALANAHHGPWAGVGSEVHNANPGAGWSDAVYLMGYSTWMPPASRGEAHLAATHNTSYKTDLLREFGDRLPDLLTVEPILQQELLHKGHRLYVEPEAKFLHENETSLRSASVLYRWNRSLGRIRSEISPSGRLKKLIYLALVPVVPLRRFARLGWYFLRKRRRHLWSLIRQAPRIWILDLLAATGLALGMLSGTPDDDMRFTELELRGELER